MSYPIDHVIDWFLSKSSMSPKKLQKLLYYAYAWYLTFQNEDADHLEDKLFYYQFKAWVHGPVIPEVYHKYREHGFGSIPKYEGNIHHFDEDTLDILEQVWEVYGKYTGNELETITHQESPWKNARSGYHPLDRCNEVIKDEDIFNCYIERIQ